MSQLDALSEAAPSFSPLAAESVQLTKLICGLDLAKYLPMDLGSGVSAELTCFRETGKFLSANASRLHRSSGSLNPVFAGDEHPLRARFYENLADLIHFKLNGATIGVFVGHAVDWSTYYIRYIMLLPEARGQGVFQGFLSRLLVVLETAGIQRVEIEVAPSNQVQIHVLAKMGFSVSGLALSERWGALVRHTKYLSLSQRSKFLQQFCSADNRYET